MRPRKNNTDTFTCGTECSRSSPRGFGVIASSETLLARIITQDFAGYHEPAEHAGREHSHPVKLSVVNRAIPIHEPLRFPRSVRGVVGR